MGVPGRCQLLVSREVARGCSAKLLSHFEAEQQNWLLCSSNRRNVIVVGPLDGCHQC